ncbi:Asp23/Gls24 family envelope stress response protein [Anaerovorax odorimutans]|uniref:Asp23/Gls24 family envelope stress response protein n=1 Tax=Anaerovorax odorimutans TaxID=109327 RepID=UPI000414E080|nr:Asp23/Gls24 family envelope stress response protein [Anaerovorax odorimutans]
MKVYGLVGKSGTGKSYQAMNLCKKKNIECIIDDGLFIFGNRILAGISAKRQDTKIAAIKTALFTNEEHRASVTNKIKEIKPKSILIIGTSEKMIYKIVKQLDLEPIGEMISIEHITTEVEREIARKQRQELGKHVIPVPTFQIKHDFSGYFVDPLRIFRSLGGRASYSEKSVVRPTFSYLGEYIISDKVISDIVTYIGNTINGIYSIIRVSVESKPEGIRITILIIVKYGAKVIEVAKKLQSEVAMQVENMTAFNIKGVDIEVRGLK